jgi:hypothetical protein
VLRERAGRIDQTGILEHIMNTYYDRLSNITECTKNEDFC